MNCRTFSQNPSHTRKKAPPLDVIGYGIIGPHFDGTDLLFEDWLTELVRLTSTKEYRRVPCPVGDPT